MATDTVAKDTARSGTWQAVQPWLTTAARLGLAAVLFLAGWAKATEPLPLQKLAVSSYQILPDSMVSVVGPGLPIFELALAALLVVGFATRFVAAISGLLMIVFIAGIISVWARGLSIDCGCFGGGGATKNPHYLQEILRDTGFFLLAAFITVWPKSKVALDGALGLYSD